MPEKSSGGWLVVVDGAAQAAIPGPQAAGLSSKVSCARSFAVI